MNGLLLLVALLVQCLAFVAAQSDSKLQRLSKIASSNNGLVKLTSNSFNQYTEGKRKYGIVVLLTALDDRIHCSPCRSEKKSIFMEYTSRIIKCALCSLGNLILNIRSSRRASKRQRIQARCSLDIWTLTTDKLSIKRYICLLLLKLRRRKDY